MIPVTYLSDKDRARAEELKDKLPRASTREEQIAISEEIEGIESKRKPLHECTLEECTELRTTVYDKYSKLNRTGKYGMALSFKNMLVLIEQRLRVLHLEQAKKEAERLKLKQQERAEQLKQKKAKDEDSSTKARTSTGTSRWTVGVGNLD